MLNLVQPDLSIHKGTDDVALLMQVNIPCPPLFGHYGLRALQYYSFISAALCFLVRIYDRGALIVISLAQTLIK